MRNYFVLAMVVALVFVEGCVEMNKDLNSGNPDPGNLPLVNQNTNGNRFVDEKFTGKISSVNFGCAVDGSCDMIVDGVKYVHFGHDTRMEEPTKWGNSDELWELWHEDSEQGVGRTVEVFAATDDHEGYTIQGKNEYYIKVLK